jgi:hypothetical protein
MKGRKVFGGIVPYGQVWRTGANEATTLTTEADLQIGTLAVPKGTYTVYTIPEQGQWTLIVNKQTGQWGTEYAQGQDLGRVPMKVSKTNKPVEMFTIAIEPKGQGGTLKMSWENTAASLDFTAK